jgi:hypothetical protein
MLILWLCGFNIKNEILCHPKASDDHLHNDFKKIEIRMNSLGN